MTREEAQRCWGQIEQELSEALLKRRPKVKSFEAHHTFAVARKAIIGVYETSPSYAHLREVVRNAVGI